MNMNKLENTKLLDFQKKVGTIAKDSTNPHFKSKYFDINKLIEEVKPILNEIGLVIIQPLTNLDSKPALRTIIYDGETGDSIVESIIQLPYLEDAQKMGSAITYYRRYALQSLLFLQAEDDDANNASQPRTFNKGYAEELAAKKLKQEVPF